MYLVPPTVTPFIASWSVLLYLTNQVLLAGFFMFWWRSWFFMLFEFLLKPRLSHLSNITFSSAAVTCNREVDERLMMQEKDKKDRSGHWLLGVKG